MSSETPQHSHASSTQQTSAIPGKMCRPTGVPACCGSSENTAASPLLAAWLTAACACFGLAAFAMTYFEHWRPFAPYFYAFAYAFGGFVPVGEVLGSLRERRLDVNLLMVLAAGGAAVIGDWGEGATLLFLFSLSGALEKYTLERTARSISALIELRPDTVLVLRNGAELRVPVEELEIGEQVRVHPGERLAIDGVVAEGQTSIDQAAITGESMPVDKQSGDLVFAGTLNQRGSVIVRVTRRSDETKLAEIVRTVREAQDAKGHTETFIQRWQKSYVIGVLLASAGSAVFHYYFRPPEVGFSRWGGALYHAMVLLVAASPCAVVIAIPAATLAGITRAAKSGVLFKAGAYLERLADVTVLAWDKTGTLTEGRPSVISVWGYDGGEAGRALSENEVLRAAAAVEQHSEHLFAQAVLSETKTRGLELLPSVAFESHTGAGVHATVNNIWTGAGTERLFESHGINLPRAVLEKAAEVRAAGRTALIIGNQEAQFGVVAVADAVRPEAAQIITRARELGIRQVIVLTGDHENVAAAVGRAVGADRVIAQLLPAQKVTEVARAQREFGPVAMLGDGVNDAPALAAADLGIAMGGAGTDVALETADIVLMKNDLRGVVTALWIAQRTRAAIKRGLLFAFAVISVLVLGSLFDILPLWIAVIGHEGSTVCTVFSGLYLLVEKE